MLYPLWANRQGSAATLATDNHTGYLPSRSMRIALAVLGSIVVVVLAVVLLGTRLPVGHVATRVLRLNQAPQAVWAALTDFAGQATWRTDVSAVRRKEGSARETWIEVGPGGELPFETTEMDPPRHLVRTIADPSLPFGGKWTYDLAPDGTGTRLTITEDGEVYNPLFRFVSHYFRDQAATIETVMQALATHFKEPARISPT